MGGLHFGSGPLATMPSVTTGFVSFLQPHTIGIGKKHDNPMDAKIFEGGGSTPKGKIGGSSAGGTSGAKGASTIVKSDHAVIRNSQGRRVSSVINDVQRARPADVFLQDDGRWVVRGQNGRVHILEPNGEVVTTMSNVTRANLNQRIANERWMRLTLEQETLFGEIFSNYVNWLP